MDADIDGITALVGDFYHLLETRFAAAARCGVDGHTHQTAETADTVIDVNHEVAHLELLNLLQRQRHLAAARFVALQVVLVETVEYLVVGKETQLGIVVGKTLVQRSVNALERDV